MRTRTLATGLLATAVLSIGFTGTASAADTFNCSDFATQQQAQAEFDRLPGDPSNLDSDDDGIACETLASGGTTQGASEDGTVTGSQVSNRPTGGVAAGDGSSSESSSVLAYVLGGVAFTAAGGAAVAARRSSRTTA